MKKTFSVRLPQKNPKLSLEVLEFIDKRLQYYKFGFTNDGSIVDHISQCKLREAHVKCIIKNDYLGYCEEKGIKFNTSIFQYCLKRTLDVCKEFAMKLNEDGSVPEDLANDPNCPLIFTDIEYRDTFLK